MVIHNFAILFLILIGSQRLLELLFAEKGKTHGEIFAKWTLFLLSSFYVLVLIGTIFEYFMFKRTIYPIITSLGIGMLIVRFLLKYWAVKSLGKFWSAHIEIRETHKLVKVGPYRYVRHPAYLSNIIEVLSLPLILNSFYTFFSVSFACVLLIVLRTGLEEKALVSKFGTIYEKYREETPAFIPSFRIKTLLLVKRGH